MRLLYYCILLLGAQSISLDPNLLNSVNSNSDELLISGRRLLSFSCNIDTNNTKSAECSYHGRCIDGKYCECDKGYLSTNFSVSVQCDYEQKKQLYAFLYQLISPFCGYGWFYLNEYIYGAIMMGEFWLGVIFLMIGKCIKMCEKEKNKKNCCCNSKCYRFIGSVLIASSILWSIVRLIFIAVVPIHDAYGFSLLPWK